jgi:hypothetical protein
MRVEDKLTEDDPFAGGHGSHVLVIVSEDLERSVGT